MTLIDANVLIDLISADQKWKEWSARTLRAVADESEVAINPIIYAEVSMGCETLKVADEAVEGLRRLSLPYEAGFLAGRAFLAYRRRGGQRQSPLPDFYIGAHAAVAGLRLLTRDRRRYTRYFPSVRLIAPD